MNRQRIPQSSFDRTHARAAISRLATENAPANRIFPGVTNLTLNPRTVLVKVDFVMDVRGVSAETAYAWADGGIGDEQLVFVFNVAADWDGKIRDLRFWAHEVLTPRAARKMEINEAIEAILGDRKNFHSGEVCHLLRVRRPTLLALRDELDGRLQRVGGVIFPRAGIRDFLKTRWLGHQPTGKKL
jgi:hypothetical protein